MWLKVEMLKMRDISKIGVPIYHANSRTIIRISGHGRI